jgi:hypothetical protein
MVTRRQGLSLFAYLLLNMKKALVYKLGWKVASQEVGNEDMT